MPTSSTRTAALLGEALEEGDALGVGPVQVVEHDDAGRADREVAHDLEPEPQALVGGPVGVGEEGEPLVVLGLPGRERVEEQLERAPERARVGLAARGRPCRPAAGR